MTYSSMQRTSQGSRRQAYEAGQSPLELLPPELLQKILGNLELKYDHREGGSSNDSSDVNHSPLERPTLFSCLPVKDSLEYLDASADLTVGEEINEKDTERLLKHTSRTIKTLKLKGWKMDSACVAQLKGLNQAVEELSIVRKKPLIYRKSIQKYTTVLDTMERAIAICKLRRRLSTTPLPTFAGAKHSLRYLDIRGMTLAEQSKIRSSTLLGKQSVALDVIAVNDRLMDREGTLKEICASVGWSVKRDGRRCLLVRRKT
ncbi:hypothetical protein DID88_002681 [Monilinia fructigena]|uniref:Uncharacterized protein n=1 Tax=Monilinia fructigena TaxID=38457 RepID=A0A395IPI7_9HELO|nr:hypothetical protein DID88_002681 [Monilinia fructigena]